LFGLTAPLNQIQGAFVMLECDDAVNLLKANRIIIEKFAASSGPADVKDAELVADSFSNLGLYTTALQRKQPDVDELLRPVLQRLGIAPLRVADPLPVEAPALPAPLEIDLDAQKRSLAASLMFGSGNRKWLDTANRSPQHWLCFVGTRRWPVKRIYRRCSASGALLDKPDLQPEGAREYSRHYSEYCCLSLRRSHLASLPRPPRLMRSY
jgi:hypothetical protein